VPVSRLSPTRPVGPVNGFAAARAPTENPMPRAKTIMVDLDGVVCTEESFFERPLARPIPGAREALRRLRAAGFTVVIYTARSWGELPVTRRWLAEHGIEYDGLHMGKPVADLWIDDRAIRFTNWRDTLATIRALDRQRARFAEAKSTPRGAPDRVKTARTPTRRAATRKQLD
jgi:hypothetical protein